ncbi:hypothetical protein [Flagellimonas beolgyonensis]|uniref:hypothetical protein n=1 Tax=Flagellimonas beolgyonensis TaxID=864064 RepID=UPI003D6579EC
MQRISGVLLVLISVTGMAQEPPPQILQAFREQFPNQKVLAWSNDSRYDYEGDLNEGFYTEDVDHESTDAQKAQILKNDHGYTPYRPYDWQDSIGKTYPPQNFEAPSQYWADFVLDGVSMSAKFKADGTFVIAIGTVTKLPKKVTEAVQKAFSGQDFSIRGDMEKVIVPSSATDIYRIFVWVRHQRRHVLKINGNGKIISNTFK